MHRLMVETEVLERSTVELSDKAARHLKVLRPRPGERIELFDGRGRYRIYSYDGALVAAAGIGEEPPPAGGLELFACVTKGSRWDWTLEKATELGVTRIVPVVSERTIVRIGADEREAKRQRWLRVVEDAARQSGSRWVPEVLPAQSFGDALEMAAATECFAGALTDPPSPGIMAALKRKGIFDDSAGEMRLSTFIGPEGDFTPGELEALLRVATPVSFGPRVLRAETAAIFALGVLMGAKDMV